MPFGDLVLGIPPLGSLVFHVLLFWAGAWFARRAFGAGSAILGWGFLLFALAEISYMTYHLDWTVLLFANTVSDGLDLLAFALVFVAASRTHRARPDPASVTVLPERPSPLDYPTA